MPFPCTLWHQIEEFGPVAEIHFFRGGGQSLLNFRQNFQISDIPPPFALEKTVFSPLLDQKITDLDSKITAKNCFIISFGQFG
jgi:hypothetical protein